MNQWAEGFFGRPTIADWKRQLDFTTKIFRARGLHLDDRHVQVAGGAGFSASIVDAAMYVTNNHERLRRGGSSVVLYLPKIQTAEEAALWNDILSALEAHLGSAGRNDQGVRPRRAGRSVLPVDGDSRGARPALRRFQHGPLGLHQQRVGRDGVGSVVHQPEHRRDHDDLRLHAQLRGPRAPGREHSGSRRAVRALAGRHGAEHSRGLDGRRRERDEARGGRW